MWITFGPVEHHHTSHFNINENFVPVEFLSLVSNALLESYPRSDTLAMSESRVTSPAVGELLESLRVVFAALPPDFAGLVLAPVKAGLAVWLADESHIAEDNLAFQVCNLNSIQPY